MGENGHHQDPIVLVIDFHHARWDLTSRTVLSIFRAKGGNIPSLTIQFLSFLNSASPLRYTKVLIKLDLSFRGPEVELCFAEEGSNPIVENDWSLLPFMALSDGAHTYITHLLCRPWLSLPSLFSPWPYPDMMTWPQSNRRLFLLLATAQLYFQAAGNLPVRHLLHQADWYQCINLQAARCNTVDSAKSSGGGDR